MKKSDEEPVTRAFEDIDLKRRHCFIRTHALSAAIDAILQKRLQDPKLI